MSPLELNEARDVAARAVQAGMDVVTDWRERGADLEVRCVPSSGGLYDQYVTALDEAAEAAVIAVLRLADPGTSVIGEVSGGEPGDERTWVVDPLDGTTNLVLGEQFVGVTVALLEHGQPLVGATGCPFTGELWSAARGSGAFDRRGRRIELVETGRRPRRIAFDPPESSADQRAKWKTVRTRLTGTFQVEPRAAIALELAYLAAGAFDGLVQVGGADVQDFAAGVLLVREAGGLVTGLDGCADPWRSDVIVAGTPHTYHELRAALDELGGS